MNLLVVGTIFIVLGLGPLVDATGVAGLRGLPEDETSCLAVVKAALAEYRVLYEQGLKDSPNLMDAKSDVPQKAVPTEEHKEIMPANITNGGLVTEKKEQLSPQESTIVTSVERKNVTEKGDGLQKVERTEEIKEIMPGNITNEVLVKQKEEQLSPQESTIVTSVERKNVTEKDDGLQNVERTREIKEIMPGNITNEVLVKQKEEQLSPQESTKVTSVERKNVTEKGDGKDVEKETVIQKEVEKNVCDSDIKEVRNEKHLNETIEDLKHQVDDVKNKIKEEKEKAEETNATRSPCVVKEPSAAPVIQDGKVVEKIVPAVTPAKVAEKIHPTMTEGKVPVVTKEKVVEQAAPSVTEEIVSISKEQEKVPVMAEEKKVIEKIIPSVTEGKVPVVPQQEVVEKVAPSPTEEKVPVVTQERAIEQNAPQERVIEQAAPQERVIEQAAPQERVIEQAAPEEKATEQAAPTATEEIVTVSKEKEEVPVVTEEKVPVVTNETVIEKITPTVTEGKVPVVPQQEVVEKITPTETEGKVPVVPQQEVVEKITPTETEGKVPVVPQQEVVEKVAPSPTEEKVPVVTQERAVEQNAPQERVIEQAAPTATEEIVTVSKEKEEVPVVVTEEKVPDVTNETVIEKITPSVTEEKDANQRKVVSYEDATENQENQVTGDEETDKTELKFIVTIQERIVREQTVSIIPVMDKGANKRANGKLVKKAMKRVAKKVARAVLEELSREHNTDGEGQ
ncbi:FK506-binding protein 5-like isoform X7 [Eriocheir sinensis]|uniref:FK506-binding protein 5-like isoform X7 n=1 Tax=Eriocheir sinensis TaxID=95602 RepID=UPI0021C6CB44|nr:FK506-binding protein 5-like isoform X7 [Eriocheir sinensis]